MEDDFRNLTAKVWANLDNPIKRYDFSKVLLRFGDVAGTSHQSRVKLVSATNGDVAETSRRCLRDLLETERSLQKKSNMFDFSATPRRPGLSPGDVAATSRRRLRD